MSIPPYRRVADQLRAEILAGEWDRPDRPLPGARGIGERFGVSIHTANRSIQQLADEGFVIVRSAQSPLVVGPLTRPTGRTLAAENERLKSRNAMLRRAYRTLHNDRKAFLHDLQAAETAVAQLSARVQIEREINQASGCPDCGVHDGCNRVVAERDRLRAVVEAASAILVAIDSNRTAAGYGPADPIPEGTTTLATHGPVGGAGERAEDRNRGLLNEARAAPEDAVECSCAYFTDVDFTMTDLACPIHGEGGTHPAPDQPGKRSADAAPEDDPYNRCRECGSPWLECADHRRTDGGSCCPTCTNEAGAAPEDDDAD